MNNKTFFGFFIYQYFYCSVANNAWSVKIQNSKTGVISRGTHDAVGYDLYAAEDNLIGAGCTSAIRTSVKLEMPSSVYAMVLGRSGIALSHSVLTHPGLIDPDYRGEIKVIMHNISPQSFRVTNGNRIAQLVFMPRVQPRFSMHDNLSPSKRGSGGFGSTGK